MLVLPEARTIQKTSNENLLEGKILLNDKFSGCRYFFSFQGGECAIHSLAHGLNGRPPKKATATWSAQKMFQGFAQGANRKLAAHMIARDLHLFIGFHNTPPYYSVRLPKLPSGSLGTYPPMNPSPLRTL